MAAVAHTINIYSICIRLAFDATTALARQLGKRKTHIGKAERGSFVSKMGVCVAWPPVNGIGPIAIIIT